MREAIAGMYGSVYIHNLLILLCYVPIALLIGLGIRPLLAGLNRLFDLKLSETEFMVCEEPDDQLSRSAQLSMLLKPLFHKTTYVHRPLRKLRILNRIIGK